VGGRQFSRLLAAEVCAISGSNAGYTVFRGSVKGTGYQLHSPVSPFTSPPVCHRVPSHLESTWPCEGSYSVPKLRAYLNMTASATSVLSSDLFVSGHHSIKSSRKKKIFHK